MSPVFSDPSELIVLPVAGDIIGAFLSGFLLYLLGRKKNLILTNLLFLLPLLMFVSDTGAKVDFAGVVILYFAHRFLVVTLHVYVAEMTEPKLRVPFLGLFFVGYKFGSMVGHFLPAASKLPIFGCFVLVIAALVLAFMAPESPYWLALTNRRETAEEVYETVRAGTGDPDEAFVAFDKAEADAETRRQRGFVRVVFRSAFLVPLLVVFFMLLANNEMCFIIKPTIDELKRLTLEKEKRARQAYLDAHRYYGNFDPFMSTPKSSVDDERLQAAQFTLEYILPVIGSVIFLALSVVVPRRLLYIGSVTSSLAIFPLLFWSHGNEFTIPFYIFMLCYLFAYLGGKQMTRILPTEIFPSVGRELGIASCDFLETMLTLLEKFSIYGGTSTWYYKLIKNARWVVVPLGLLGTVIFMPETKNLTLAEAELLGTHLNMDYLFAPPLPPDEEPADQ